MKKKEALLFKSLRADLSSNHGFPLPGAWADQTSWLGPVSFEDKNLTPYSWGLHLAKQDYLVFWLGERNFTAEYKGVVLETQDVVITEYARLKNEVFFRNKDLASLAVQYCSVVKDFGLILDSDWSISKTMQVSFDLSGSFLKACHKLKAPMPQAVKNLAGLCEWNSSLRHQDAMSSIDYFYGCQSVAYASHALSLLPVMADNDNAKNIITLKQIASDVRQAVALSIQQSISNVPVNDVQAEKLSSIFARWVRLRAEDKDLSFSQQGFFAAGRWQNDLLLKKLRMKP